MTAARLYVGEVMHRRLFPVRYRFAYRVFSLLLDIGRLDVAAAVRAVQEFCGGASAGILEILWARPNPVHTELQVRFQTPAYVEYTILVHNMLGQLMFEDTLLPTPFSNNIKKLDVSTLPAGVYSVSFGRNDAWRSVKFVKN